MLKNIVLAVLISIVLTYSFGHIATQWFDLHLSFADHDIEPLTSIIAATGIVVLLVLIGFVVALSIFGAIFFAIAAVVIGIFVAGMSVFWPAVLFAFIIYLLVRDRRGSTA